MSATNADDSIGVPQLVDIPTLARILGDSVRHIRRLVAENRIPYIKIGHFIRFDLREIARWIDAHRSESGGSWGVSPMRLRQPQSLR